MVLNTDPNALSDEDYWHGSQHATVHPEIPADQYRLEEDLTDPTQDEDV